MKTKWIKINGAERPVLNSYSSGPGEPARTYDVPGGYVYKVGARWLLQRPGLEPVAVDVKELP